MSQAKTVITSIIVSTIIASTVVLSVVSISPVQLGDSAGLQRRIDDLKKSLDENSAVISQLRSTITQQARTIDDMRNSLLSQYQTIQRLQSDLQTLQLRIEKREAFATMRKALVKPGEAIANQITEQALADLQPQVREVLKGALAAAINSKIPEILWQDDTTDRASQNLYKTTMKASFPIKLNVPIYGDVTFSSIDLKVEGTVDIQSGAASNLKVVSVQFGKIFGVP